MMARPEAMTGNPELETRAVIPFLIVVLWYRKFFIFLFGLNKRSLALKTPND